MKYLSLVILFVLAFLERVAFNLGPNVELVTVSMLLAAAYVGRKESFLLTLLLMMVTDLVIGNSNIFIFTWSGFLIPALLVRKVIRKNKIVTGTLAGIGANLFFYLWTNFGVWLVGRLYPPTAGGLISSYINALPFLKMQLFSTLLFAPTGFTIVEIARWFFYSTSQFWWKSRFKVY